jgi:hypothetical protein
MKSLPLRTPAGIVWIALMSAIAVAAQTGRELVVQFPKDWPVVAAEAQASPNAPIDGKVSPGNARFLDLDSQARYDVKLTLGDGRILQGVDMGWYNADPPAPEAGDLDDDDREQIAAILNLPSFFNRRDLATLRGNHDRAVALIQLIRDQPFAGDNGQSVVWRVELWYMKNQHGGWVKESAQVLRRQRFDNPQQFQQAAGKLTWVPDIGGISVPADSILTVLAPEIPATQPTTAK